MGQAVVFVLVVLIVVAGLHYYLWQRLVHATTRPGRGRRTGTAILLALIVLLVAALVGSRVFPHRVAVALAWPGYLWLGVMFYLLVGLLLLEVPALVIRFILYRRAARPVRVPAPVGDDPRADDPRADDPRADDPPGADPPGRDTPGHDTPGHDTPEADPPSRGMTGGPPGIGTAGADRSVPSPPDRSTRRLFLGRGLALAAGIAAVGSVGSGVGSALGSPQLKRVQIPLARLPRAADGMRIALVSDIHLGPLAGESRTRQIVEMINGLDADLVAIVGDLADGSVDELGQAAAPLRDLRARYGSYFVTGNHEYFSGYVEWVDEVASFGVRPLHNERMELPGGLDLAGINDVTGATYGDSPDIGRALAGRDPGRAVVLLAHQPVQAHEAAAHGVDLQLSGHTHGGQIVPFNLVVRASGQPIVSGFGHVDGMPVYVTNGAGFWGPPVRVGAPSDITLVQLATG